MSYIRSLSNPEKLYIWGDAGDTVSISEGSSDKPLLTMPRSVFREMLKAWLRTRGDITLSGAFLTENSDCKWVLWYKDWDSRSVVMYETTLFYIAKDNDL